MAQTIRVTQTMRNIIDFYKEENSSGLDYDVLTDSDYIRAIMIRWFMQNYDYNVVKEVLDRP